MGRILDLSEKLWNEELSVEHHQPFMPLLELGPIADGVASISSFANVTAIATGEGLVLVDVGSLPLAPMIFSQLRGWSTERVNTAVFTHGHLDHVMGIGLFDDEARTKGLPLPRVIAHELVPVRFARYSVSAGYNACVNSRQFQMPIAWPTTFRAPDVLYATEEKLEVGGVAIELHHARGETCDHTLAWGPSKQLLGAG